MVKTRRKYEALCITLLGYSRFFQEGDLMEESLSVKGERRSSSPERELGVFEA